MCVCETQSFTTSFTSVERRCVLEPGLGESTAMWTRMLRGVSGSSADYWETVGVGARGLGARPARVTNLKLHSMCYYNANLALTTMRLLTP